MCYFLLFIPGPFYQACMLQVHVSPTTVQFLLYFFFLKGCVCVFIERMMSCPLRSCICFSSLTSWKFFVMLNNFVCLFGLQSYLDLFFYHLLFLLVCCYILSFYQLLYFQWGHRQGQKTEGCWGAIRAYIHQVRRTPKRRE